MKRFLATASVLALMATASNAADYPMSYETDVWSGYFVGIQGGYGWGEAEDDTGVAEDIEGGLGGLYYGRNWQSGSWIYGIDSSISFSDINYNLAVAGVGDAELSIEGFSATRLKLGYAFDNFNIFAAGGFTLARAKFEIDTIAGNDDDDSWLKGFTVGAGVEAKIADNWSARVEYLYLNWGEETLEVTIPGVGVAGGEVELDAHVVRAGIAYHF